MPIVSRPTFAVVEGVAAAADAFHEAVGFVAVPEPGDHPDVDTPTLYLVRSLDPLRHAPEPTRRPS